MANLAGQFAGVVQLEVAASNASSLDAALHSLEGKGLRVTTTLGDPPTRGTDTELHRLQFVCQDHPGIVRDTSRTLVRNGVSIEDLFTDRVSGGFSGEQMFHASAQLRVPVNLEIGQLREELETHANELIADLTFDGAGLGRIGACWVRDGS